MSGRRKDVGWPSGEKKWEWRRERWRHGEGETDSQRAMNQEAVAATMKAFSKMEAAEVEEAWIGETRGEFGGEEGEKLRMPRFPGETGCLDGGQRQEERGEDAGECPCGIFNRGLEMQL